MSSNLARAETGVAVMVGNPQRPVGGGAGHGGELLGGVEALGDGAGAGVDPTVGVAHELFDLVGVQQVGHGWRSRVSRVAAEAGLDVGREDIGTVVGEEPAQPVSELDLAAAAPTEREMLVDPRSRLLVDDAVEVFPQLAHGVTTADHTRSFLRSPLRSAWSHSCFSNGFRPRCSRARIVPNGAPTIRATSLVANPCMCTKTSGTR
jgi:hypothetical protein